MTPTVSTRVMKALLAQLRYKFAEKQAELTQKQAELAQTQAELAQIRAELAHKQAELDVKDLMLKETNLTKQACKEEMVTVLNESTQVFWDISEEVLDLTKDLLEFQYSRAQKSDEAKAITPAATGLSQPRPVITPHTLFSAKQDVSRKIADAKAELAKAVKVWKRAKAGLETMQAYNRKRFLANVLGKEDPAGNVIDLD